MFLLSPQSKHLQPGMQPSSPLLVNMLPTGMQPMVQPLHGLATTPAKATLLSPKGMQSPFSPLFFSPVHGHGYGSLSNLLCTFSPMPCGPDFPSFDKFDVPGMPSDGECPLPSSEPTMPVMPGGVMPPAQFLKLIDDFKSRWVIGVAQWLLNFI